MVTAFAILAMFVQMTCTSLAFLRATKYWAFENTPPGFLMFSHEGLARPRHGCIEYNGEQIEAAENVIIEI